MKILLWIFATLIGAGFSPGWAVDQALHYEPAVSTLTGTLMAEEFFGPPNYGANPQSDARETAYILYLDMPVTVVGDPKDALNPDTFDGVTRIQLVPDTDGTIIGLAGRHVSVTGVLFQHHTGHHYTEILMQVSAITVAER